MLKQKEVPMTQNAKEFKMPVRIYYEDTDTGGIVYHANYLRYAERCRSEWLRSVGVESSKLAEEKGTFFVVKSCSINYHAPAKLDDELIVTNEVEKIGGASISLKQGVYKENQLYVSMDVVIVLVDGNKKPVRIDPELKAQLLS